MLVQKHYWWIILDNQTFTNVSPQKLLAKKPEQILSAKKLSEKLFYVNFKDKYNSRTLLNNTPEKAER